MKNLNEKINNLPMSNGCYIFINKHRQIIYIGKSKHIKKRVKQYFSSNQNKHYKIIKLANEIDDIFYINTQSESDALLLECYLIKKNKPKYNTMLKHNITFPLIKIDIHKLCFSICYEKDNKNNDEALYFGFFRSETDARRIIEFISCIWKTPTCEMQILKTKRACLRYHIGKCTAPCVNADAAMNYKQTLGEIVHFLKSEDLTIINRLEQEMLYFAENLLFEKANENLEKINILKKLAIRIRRINNDIKNKKILLLFRAFNEPTFSIFYIDDETIIDRQVFFEPSETMGSLKTQLKKYIIRLENKLYYPCKRYIKSSYLLEIPADKFFIDTQNNPVNVNNFDYFYNIINEFASQVQDDT